VNEAYDFFGKRVVPDRDILDICFLMIIRIIDPLAREYIDSRKRAWAQHPEIETLRELERKHFGYVDTPKPSLETESPKSSAGLGIITPDPMVKMLGPGYMRFASPFGINGAARESANRVDLLGDAGLWAEPRNAFAWFLIQRGITVEPAMGNAKLKEAAAICQGTLAFNQRGKSPQDWAATQNNLGIALQELGWRSTGEEGRKLLEGAVVACRSAPRGQDQGRSASVLGHDPEQSGHRAFDAWRSVGRRGGPETEAGVGGIVSGSGVLSSGRSVTLPLGVCARRSCLQLGLKWPVRGGADPVRRGSKAD
jgi:hypothetical protein